MRSLDTRMTSQSSECEIACHECEPNKALHPAADIFVTDDDRLATCAWGLGAELIASQGLPANQGSGVEPQARHGAQW
jgi:hypothetical protein